jgi:hypothetical protein
MIRGISGAKSDRRQSGPPAKGEEKKEKKTGEKNRPAKCSGNKKRLTKKKQLVKKDKGNHGAKFPHEMIYNT